MAGTDNLIYIRSLKGGVPSTISMFCAATTGLYQKLDLNAIATTNSPDNAIAPHDFLIEDIIADSTGPVEIVINGKRTGIIFELGNFGATNAGRPKPNVRIRKGAEVRILAAGTLTVA